MTANCLRQTSLPGITQLFMDYLYDFESVEKFYPGNPWRAESYRVAAAKVDYPDVRRAAVVSALRKYNGESASLDLLELPETVAVVTGQQVGLFAGPAYTIYKALTAAKLAAQLNEQGIPAVPVFWLATQDHDYEEVRHVWFHDASRTPVELSLAERDGPAAAVGSLPLGDLPFDALRPAIEPLPYGDEVLALIGESYVSGQTLGGAFFELMRRLLSGHGVIFLDQLQPEMRELAGPVLAEAVKGAGDLVESGVARSRQLEDAGYHAQVHLEKESSLFFLLEAGDRRVPLRRRGKDFTANGKECTASDLMERAADISPNALLRPVVQDYLLPTVAYIGGPAEIAYLAQSQPLYKQLLGRAPLAVPRAGFTLLDSRTRRLLARYRLRPEDCFTGREGLRERMAAALVPEDIKELFPNFSEAIDGMLILMRRDLLHFDPTLAAALEKSASKMRYQVSKMESKVARETFRREERAGADADYLSHSLFPHRHPQERFYSILPFLAEHGLPLIDTIRENIRLDCPDHVVLSV